MKCPVCKDVTLLMSQKNGIEIDYCPECRGIWLDRGELDKIIERANHQDYSNHHDSKSSKPKKRSSVLKDIFEMFGE